MAGGTNDHPGTIFGVNYIIGGTCRAVEPPVPPLSAFFTSTSAGDLAGIKVSQLRVKKQGCPNLHGMSSRRPVTCYGDMSAKGAWSSDAEETAPFGSNGVTFTWSGAPSATPSTVVSLALRDKATLL